MLLQNIPTHHMKQFTYISEDNVLVAEASDFDGLTEFGRIFDDAADVGFYVLNPDTGTKVLFTHVHEVFDDREGELVASVYAPADIRYQSDYMTEKMQKLHVHVYKD